MEPSRSQLVNASFEVKKINIPPTIQSLPTEVLANILIFVTTASSRICELLDGLLISDNHGKEQDIESVFRALCQLNDWNTQQPGGTKQYSEVWPKNIGWKTLYLVLEKWIPREGFYSVHEAHPWGLLLRLRFARQSLECDLLWPREENQEDTVENASLFETVPFFKVREFRANGSTRYVEFHSGIMAMDKVSITPMGWPENCAGGGTLVLSKSFEYPDRFSNHPNMGYGPLDSLGGQLAHHLLWNPLNPSQPEDLLRSLFKNSNRMTLNMVVRPSLSPTLPSMKGLPQIQPGLYSGVYMNAYGKFKREIIQIEFLRFDFGDDNGTQESDTGVWDDVQAKIFNESDLEDDRGLFGLIRVAASEAMCKTIVFVVGRKVTGDYHVPMGKISFRALAYPDLGLERFFDTETPTRVIDRGGNGRRQCSVVNSWHAWGTLAAPQFQSPRWSPGRFVQVHDHAHSASLEQFGFILNDDDSQATILTRLPEQDEFTFYS